ncbi:MAG: class I SAM-dependent methyltransferase [Phycisphaerae bacterium]|nr:class I SAM-dependent methyltransferase [Phycisphaerae bacterium]
MARVARQETVRMGHAPPTNPQQTITPTAPHDDLSFEDLAARYNFERTSRDALVLTRLIIKECERRTPPVRVLDIGCGSGIARSVEAQWCIRPHADAYWGVEPDPSKVATPGLFDEYRTAVLEDADLPPDTFDVAYSSMVMEHVEDPDGFMRAVHRCLRPGGVYLFMTPNRRHYFTRIAATLHRLKLDEMVLRGVKGASVEEYHYPVRYKFNDEPRIDACAERLGFHPPQYVYLEAQGPKGYFPRPLRFIFHALAAKRRMIKNPRQLLGLVARIEKARTQP